MSLVTGEWKGYYSVLVLNLLSVLTKLDMDVSFLFGDCTVDLQKAL